MRITHDDVRRIARLARLRLDDGDVDLLRGDLDAILGYVDTLGEIDTAAVEPAPPAAGPPGPLREDRPSGSLDPGQALSNAPESGGGHFKVPRIIT